MIQVVYGKTTMVVECSYFSSPFKTCPGTPPPPLLAEHWFVFFIQHPRLHPQFTQGVIGLGGRSGCLGHRCSPGCPRV